MYEKYTHHGKINVFIALFRILNILSELCDKERQLFIVLDVYLEYLCGRGILGKISV